MFSLTRRSHPVQNTVDHNRTLTNRYMDSPTILRTMVAVSITALLTAMLLTWIYTASASSRTTVNSYNPTISCKMITVVVSAVSTTMCLTRIYTSSTSSRTAINPLGNLYKNRTNWLANDAPANKRLLLLYTSINIHMSLNLRFNPKCLNRILLLNNLSSNCSSVMRRCYYCELLQLWRRLRLRIYIFIFPSFWSPWTLCSLVVTRTTPTSLTVFLSNL